MGDFWEDVTTCPLCGKNFSFTKIKYDSIIVKKYEDDLKPIYSGPNPLNYSILTCPKCGFTYYSDKSGDSLKKVSKEQKNSLKEYLKLSRSKLGRIDNSKDKSIDFLKKQYAQAIVLYKIIDKPEIVAKSMIRLAWIFRDEEKIKEELKLLFSAVEILEQNFKNLNSDEDLILYYFFKGYTHLRIGKKKIAKEFFNKLIARYKKSNNPYVRKAEYLKGEL
ncbi:hypothetical protein JCM30566_00330 [Marinitoga arctica]